MKSYSSRRSCVSYYWRSCVSYAAFLCIIRDVLMYSYATKRLKMTTTRHADNSKAKLELKNAKMASIRKPLEEPSADLHQAVIAPANQTRNTKNKKQNEHRPGCRSQFSIFYVL